MGHFAWNHEISWVCAEVMIVVQYKMSTLLENIHSICIKTKGVIGILDLHINYGGGGGGGGGGS